MPLQYKTRSSNRLRCPFEYRSAATSSSAHQTKLVYAIDQRDPSSDVENTTWCLVLSKSAILDDSLVQAVDDGGIGDVIGRQRCFAKYHMGLSVAWYLFHLRLTVRPRTIDQYPNEPQARLSPLTASVGACRCTALDTHQLSKQR